VAFALPLSEPERFNLVVGVDHDPAVSAGDDPLGSTVCTDYLERGFPHCYDEHDGSDYILQGGFGAMDEGSTHILAGADGTVTLARDGHYDRCRADASGVVDCDGHEMVANAVILEHTGTDGRRYRSKYWHMMKDTVAVEEGQDVHQGDVLGKVGSSGNSSMPHLHFQLEVEVAADTWEVVDPYAGPASQELSYWCAQGPAEGLPGGC
jgi:murein DD-endopeptidase MepM/ murein hydrolase activator NlpD